MIERSDVRDRLRDTSINEMSALNELRREKCEALLSSLDRLLTEMDTNIANRMEQDPSACVTLEAKYLRISMKAIKDLATDAMKKESGSARTVCETESRVVGGVVLLRLACQMVRDINQLRFSVQGVPGARRSSRDDQHGTQTRLPANRFTSYNTLGTTTNEGEDGLDGSTHVPMATPLLWPTSQAVFSSVVSRVAWHAGDDGEGYWIDERINMNDL